MRFFYTFLFVFLILSKIAYSVFWQVNFYVNQKEIAAKECVNKNRPEMHCNGKCYLSKQLKKADAELESQKEKQQGSYSNLKIIEGASYIPNEKIFFELNSSYKNVSKQNYIYYNTYKLEFHFSIFHPPTSTFNV
jgi:hypothetical protein